jgi:hypothetical protein
MWWLLRVITCITFWIAVTTYCIYWYETANQKENQGKTPFRHILWGILDSMLGALFLALTYPFGRLNRIREPRHPRKTGPVIVCLHGLFHNPSAWILLRLRLHRAGFHNCYCPRYRSFRNDIPGAIRELELELKQILEKHPEQEIIFIGHSLGGLLALYLGTNNRSWPVREIVTLGTPFSGSKMAVFGISSLAKSLLPNSREFKNLCSGINWKTTIPGLALYSAIDNMVLPLKSLQSTPERWELKEAGPTSHIGMLWSKKVSKELIKRLRT